MEVKITISDTGGASVVSAAVPEQTGPAAPIVSAALSAAPAEAGGVTDAGGASGSQSGTSTQLNTGPGTPPLEILAKAVIRGASSAGPAPSFSAMETGAPPLFITGDTAHQVAGSTAMSPAESAGAAPGSEALTPVFMAPEGGAA